MLGIHSKQQKYFKTYLTRRQGKHSPRYIRGLRCVYSAPVLSEMSPGQAKSDTPALDRTRRPRVYLQWTPLARALCYIAKIQCACVTVFFQALTLQHLRQSILHRHRRCLCVWQRPRRPKRVTFCIFLQFKPQHGSFVNTLRVPEPNTSVPLRATLASALTEK